MTARLVDVLRLRPVLALELVPTPHRGRLGACFENVARLFNRKLHRAVDEFQTLGPRNEGVRSALRGPVDETTENRF